MFGLYHKKEQSKQTLASTILRLCLAFQLVASCAWSPSFAEASDAAKPAAEAAATVDSAEKTEKIKIASVDSIIEDEKQEKKKNSKLKPVKLPRAEAKLIAAADANDATASSADGKAIACKGECKDDATKATGVESKSSQVADDSKDDAKSKRRWFGLKKTEEEKAIADAKWKEQEAKDKADADAQAKKWADEKAGKELAKKARAEAKAKEKAEKQPKKDDKASKEDKDVKAEAPATEAAAAVNLPAATVPAAAPVTATPAVTTAPAVTPATVPAVTGWGTEGTKPEGATKEPVAETAAPAQKQAAAPNFAGEGLGGFVSGDQKELSFLQEGRVEETIGDLNVIVIDNDEVVEMEETIAYENSRQTKAKPESRREPSFL